MEQNSPAPGSLHTELTPQTAQLSITHPYRVCLTKTYQDKCTEACNKEIRERKKRDKNKQKTPSRRPQGGQQGQTRSSDTLPSASFQLHVQDRLCHPRAQTYNPVSCKNYSLKSLLNELLVRSRDILQAGNTKFTTVVHSVLPSVTKPWQHTWLHSLNLTHRPSTWAADGLCNARPSTADTSSYKPMLNRLKKTSTFTEMLIFCKNNHLLSFSSHAERHVQSSIHSLSLCQKASFTTPKNRFQAGNPLQIKNKNTKIIISIFILIGILQHLWNHFQRWILGLSTQATLQFSIPLHEYSSLSLLCCSLVHSSN